VKEIERLLGVSRSTVSLWVRDIPLTAAQRSALVRRNPIYNGQFKGAAVNAERGRKRRLAYQERGRMRAKEADALYIAGCMLYWAEGVADEQFRVTWYLFADHESRQREIEGFWLATLGLERTCLCKSVVNRYSKYSKKKRKNKLRCGTCRIAVHSTEIVQTIYGSIQELASFDRPEWLDLPP